MRVPDHAAISTSVDLVRATVGRGPAGLVNAVLRTVSRRDLAGWVDEVAPDRQADPYGHLAVARSHPRWVVDALGEALAASVGSDEELDALLEADNAPPRVTLVARPGMSTVEELEAAGGTRTGRSPYAVTLAGGDPSAVPAVAEGRAGVQDEGSQLVALALADAPLDGRDERWLDLCAGPGGKAALLAALAAQRGAVLVANERQPHRAALVASALRATPDGRRARARRRRHAPRLAPRHLRPGAGRRAVLGARCAATTSRVALASYARGRRGAGRRSSRCCSTSALESVRPGGVVVYATCSPVVAETSDVVRAVLARRGDTDEVDRFQLWPHRDGTDAMFAATLRRRAVTRPPTQGSGGAHRPPIGVTSAPGRFTSFALTSMMESARRTGGVCRVTGSRNPCTCAAS